MKFTPQSDPNPKAFVGPWTLRVGAGRADGHFDNLDDAKAAASAKLASFPGWDGSVFVCSLDGLWIAGRFNHD